jgi:hypothetical protein
MNRNCATIGAFFYVRRRKLERLLPAKERIVGNSEQQKGARPHARTRKRVGSQRDISATAFRNPPERYYSNG